MALICCPLASPGSLRERSQRPIRSQRYSKDVSEHYSNYLTSYFCSVTASYVCESGPNVQRTTRSVNPRDRWWLNGRSGMHLPHTARFAPAYASGLFLTRCNSLLFNLTDVTRGKTIYYLSECLSFFPSSSRALWHVRPTVLLPLITLLLPFLWTSCHSVSFLFLPHHASLYLPSHRCGGPLDCQCKRYQRLQLWREF
jgi:hypothetical protein